MIRRNNIWSFNRKEIHILSDELIQWTQWKVFRNANCTLCRLRETIYCPPCCILTLVKGMSLFFTHGGPEGGSFVSLLFRSNYKVLNDMYHLKREMEQVPTECCIFCDIYLLITFIYTYNNFELFDSLVHLFIHSENGTGIPTFHSRQWQ